MIHNVEFEYISLLVHIFKYYENYPAHKYFFSFFCELNHYLLNLRKKHKAIVGMNYVLLTFI